MAQRTDFHDKCIAIVESLGLGTAKQVSQFRPLTGGVSSDIALLAVDGQQICIKCALPQLKVEATWQAPLRRNLAEYRWLSFVATLIPNAVPELLGRDDQLNGFAMAYLPPESAYLYKSALLNGQPDSGQAAATGTVLARIHQASTEASFDRAVFDNAPDFYALRLEPYLDYTASQHPAHADSLRELSLQTDSARIALIHGDVSPKNLLIRDSGPVLLDAECATFSDPAFDLAFFTNHLLIKSVHMPSQSAGLLQAARQFWSAYHEQITFENANELQVRFARLLPALMLARVDGKSPVEYLDDHGRRGLRTLALHLLTIGYDSLEPIFNDTAKYIDQHLDQQH